jgi:hypothetical protein
MPIFSTARSRSENKPFFAGLYFWLACNMKCLSNDMKIADAENMAVSLENLQNEYFLIIACIKVM